MSWHRPKGPRRGPLPKGAVYFRARVAPQLPPEGARPFPELAPIVERRIKFLELRAAQSPEALSTLWTQRTILNRAVADLPPSPVPADVREWMHALVSRWGCTPRTANKYRDTLSSAFEFDRLRGGELNNPCVDVPRMRASDPLKLALSAPKAGLSPVEVYEAARAALPSLREQLAVDFCYILGLRRSEMCGIEETHLDLRDVRQAALRLVQQRKPVRHDNEPSPLKRERRRILPIPERMAAQLVELLSRPTWAPSSAPGANQYTPPVRTRFVFPFNTTDLQGIHAAIRGVCEEALPPGRGLHELRHAFAEGALDYYKGDLREVGKRLGHTSEAVTASYARGRYGSFEVRRDVGLFEALTTRKIDPSVAGLQGEPANAANSAPHASARSLGVKLVGGRGGTGGTQKVSARRSRKEKSRR